MKHTYPELTLLEAHQQGHKYTPIHELHASYVEWAKRKGRPAFTEDEFVKQWSEHYSRCYFLTVEGVACLGGVYCKTRGRRCATHATLCYVLCILWVL